MWLCLFGGNTTEMMDFSVYHVNGFMLLMFFYNFNLDNLDKVLYAELFRYDEVTFFLSFFC